MTVETNWLKPATAVASIKSLCSESAVILLDEHGKMPRDSEHFSDIIYNALEQGGSRLAIVIGDAEGLPSELLSYAEELRRTSTAVQVLSLSPLTFTHKMVSAFHFLKFPLKNSIPYSLYIYAHQRFWPSSTYLMKLLEIRSWKVRLFVYEQLYRATEIRANSKYHKWHLRDMRQGICPPY